MPLRPVIDQAPHNTPLDAAAIAVYLAVFIAVLLLTKRRAVFGLAALIVSDPFALYRDVAHTTITVPKVALIAAFLGLLWGRAAWPNALDRRARPLAIAAALIVLATALSILQADFLGPALRETLKTIEYLGMFIIALVAYATDPDEDFVRVTIVATATCVAAIALSQEYFGAPSGIWFNNHPVPRIAGPLEGPNQLSGYLGIALPLVAIFALQPAAGPWIVIALGVLACADVLTLSRAGVLSAAISLAIVFFLARSERVRPALASIAAGIIAGLGIDGAWSVIATHTSEGITRFGSIAQVERPGAVGTRSQLWHAAFTLWKAHPLLGIGAGNFELEIARVGPPGVRTHANNAYLQALCEGGIPLFAATVWAVAAPIRCFLHARFARPFALAALAAGAGLAFHEIFDYLAFYPKVGAWWWILLGLAAAESIVGAGREGDRF